MSISIPDRFYDYVIYYECGNNEKANPSAFNNVGKLEPGCLLKAVNWNATGNDVGDNAGVTHVGVTPKAISDYKKWSGNKTYVLNSANSWVMIVNYFWKLSCADQAANVACATIMCQGCWGGWDSKSIEKTCTELRNRCDKKEEASKIKGNGYSAMSQLTHCFSNPMDAFIILRAGRISYLRSLTNRTQFFGGWMRREFFAMQSDGCYCEPGSKLFTKYGSTPIPQMEQAAEQLKKDPKSGYVKLMSWDGTPSSNISLEGLDDGSNGIIPPIGDISSNNGISVGNEVSHGSIIDGGTIDFNKLNETNNHKGMLLGTTIRQK